MISNPGPLLALGCFVVCWTCALLLRLLWAAIAALLLRDCDLATKLLPERKGYWKNRVAWITGASSGIGLSLCRLLATRRCSIIISSRKEEDLLKARDDAIAYSQRLGIKRSPEDFLLLPFDMKKPESFRGVVDEGRKWKGRIDILFSNAGVACRGVMLPSSIDNEILQVNLLSQMEFVKLIVARMIQQQSGHVIFTNSMSARITLGGRTAYSTAKGALLNFAYGLSRELRGMASPVRVTTVLPGYVRTSLCDRELYADGAIPKGVHVAEDIRTGLPSDRTAELMLRGSSRGLAEIWVGKNPDLFYMYAMYYVPEIANLAVDYGASSYARNIEEEIRQRRYVARSARAPSAPGQPPVDKRGAGFKKRKASGDSALSEPFCSPRTCPPGLKQRDDDASPASVPDEKGSQAGEEDRTRGGSLPPAKDGIVATESEAQKSNIFPGAPGPFGTVANAISDAVSQLGRFASMGSDTTHDDEEQTNGGAVRKRRSFGIDENGFGGESTGRTADAGTTRTQSSASGKGQTNAAVSG
ncbi:putative oxidoreductase, short chain dehydrogenase/reductase domain-containing protein [Neospora caninum Liverpool]|uniref:Oxidoreductase, short chain dehydrogenase/reductase domain-containing protein,putative n=1 Tax=Neospora caninum (strain Liverpool) TaxID=572307 RepID=F0VJK8_NEOCL|nr:putative oxidoreductase, short chain dehydrogenase/reductase domain-containing protein [Neospora caninum Liverpool]CBZ53919.1 putative oxidoreductase, short chain dehydrogenase/reductase domain-containing protein [Neospora caninum Liverpool]CEL67917.1 TPA: oxidoreductase, short chain dehydrogenase/reductase domain-containing protein,putative [Neospora caninum Liverpool]|eukprot:XP_003883951.1 putative oxidoreductase, short chain dehydrogenase/reductase domain-containing protein [Neospora caninum Liverpool]